MKRLLLFILLSITFFQSHCQLYGNEWIDYSQSYYKFTIADEGIYRINQTTLLNAGIPITSVDPRNIEIFRNGQPVTIFVSGESDGSFDPTDFIEFIGDNNDGGLDAELYKSASEQTNPYVSLYGDSTVYFLTWKSTISTTHASTYDDPNYVGKTADLYFTQEVIQAFSEDYYIGIPASSASQIYSEYTKGEGYMTSRTRFLREFIVNTPAVYPGSSTAQLEVSAFSRNNPEEIFNGSNHEAGVAVGSSSNLLKSIQKNNQNDYFFPYNDLVFPTNLMGSTTKVFLGEVNNSARPNSEISIAYFKLKYDRSFDLANTSQLRFKSETSNTYFSFINYESGLQNPIIYDLTNGTRILGSVTSSQLRFNTSASNAKELVIYDASSVKSIALLKESNLADITIDGTNYLIITNSVLDSGATAYAQYRESMAGGSHKVKVLYVQDLYDNHFYGYHHPLAIKHGIDYMLEKLSEPIENILLLGKGQMYDLIRFDVTKREYLDLVPSIGSPPSDFLYVSKLDGSDVKIDVPIGRVSARNNTQIAKYLEKVIDHESVQSPTWQKHIMQLSGGSSESENLKFQGYLNTYYNIAKDSFLGAARTVYAKSNTNSTSSELTEEIQASINAGANIFTYFGHGSPQVLDLDIGAANTLNNRGKYPLFIFNGCSLGNLYVQSSIGEDYLFSENKGSIFWIASTGFGFADPLSEYTRILHQEMLQNQYGSSLGKCIQTTIKRYGSADLLRVLNSRQLAYHGDPALTIVSPKYPDLIVDNANVSTKFSAVDGITLEVDLKNIAKTTSDSVQLTIVAQNSDSSATILDQFIESPLNTSQLELSVPNSSLFEGLTRFRILLDLGNRIAEVPGIGESNNEYTFEHLFELQKPLVIYPQMNQIVSSSTCEFVFQIANHDKQDIEIQIEIDTNQYFNSGVHFVTTFNTSNNLINKGISLPPLDGTDFYYRIRTKEGQSLSEWVEGSFAYLFDAEEGWSEGDDYNITNANLTSLLWNVDSTNIDFGRKSSAQYSISTSGGGNKQWRRFRIAGLIGIVGATNYHGVEVVAFHPQTEQRFSEAGSKYNRAYEDRYNFNQVPSPDQAKYFIEGQQCGIYHFRINDQEPRDSFVRYLNNIPDGYHIMIRNGISFGVADWEDTVFVMLEKFGIRGMRTIGENEPFALFGTKGPDGPVKELYGDYSDTITPAWAQIIEFAFNIYPKVSEGYITTELIGPATSWSEAKIAVKNSDSPDDRFWYDVIGVRANKSDSVIYSNQTLSSLDISSINAKRFPYLKVKLNFADESNLTPMFIDRWTVHFSGVTEGAIDLDEKNYSSADTLIQGQDYSFETAFKNISDKTFDSCQVQVRLISAAGETVYSTIKPLSTIDPNKHQSVADVINTTDINGDFQLLVNVNHDKEVVETEYLNNLFYKNFHVLSDVRNPILDVVFDGFHILNKDIVSSNTLITITGSDEHPYLFLDDPSLFTITLKYPGEDSVRPINTSDMNVEFTPAGPNNKKAFMTYQAQDLADGTYTLTASLSDKSNNQSGSQPYVIDFKVINKQSISNLYPYPNPFTSCAKFVFTCTGNEVPDQILINIYTISGRLVKQIDETELGPIRIGNNMSEYCWDGTDTYGDKLANGVYLYKAEILSNGKRLDLFETGSDQLFNNGFGKLYIAR